MTRIGFRLIVIASMASQEFTLGFKWPVAVERAIAVPELTLWNAISMPGNLFVCHPFCAANPVHVWPGPDSRDEVHYLNGLVFVRRFSRWTEGVGYDLEIGTRSGKTSSVSWRITPIDAQNSILKISVFPHVLQTLPVTIRWCPHVLWLRPMLKKYLESVVKGFEWYVIRGEPVPPNKFGKHPWFSSPE